MGFAHWNVPHISLAPARGGSHRKDVGRILFWKRTRPTPRKKSTRAFRLRPGPPTTQRARAAALSLWKPSPGDGGRRWAPPLETPPGVGRGSGSRKKGRGRPVWNIGVRRTFWCGDTVPGGIGIAQPVGDFWIWSAVCDGQPPVLGDLTPSCQITPQRFFFCTVSGTFSFWQDKKKMWGTFCTAKPCLPVPHSGTVVHPCGDSPHILGSPFQGEPFKGA